jgi:hypothetical protein
MGDKIFVDSYTGGSDGGDLIECYFKYKKSDSTYDFHDKDDHTKCTGLTVGSSCSFQLDEDPDLTFTITLTSPCTETEVNGTWSVPDAARRQPGGDTEGGTFQAQGGGAAGEDVDEAAGQKIIIHHVHSKHGLSFGTPLKNCFFALRDNGTYDLCDPLDGVLKQGVTLDQEFFFQYASQDWKMTTDYRPGEKILHGSWSLLEGDSDEIDGGTFQAQAGGGGMEENAYSANA